MAKTTYLEKYIDYFSVQTGGAPKRDKLEWAIRKTVTEDDLALFFLLPAFGSLTKEQFRKKALRKGFSEESFIESLTHLCQEVFIISYDKAGKGKVYERAFVTFTLEQQVRRRKGSDIGAAYGEFWEALAGSTEKMPSKTPYFRVVPVESTLTDTSCRVTIPVGERISDSRQVLPLDMISEIVNKEPLIGVSECYCRLARENRGDGVCKYPKETCFTFNELAQTLIETGLAREVDANEAIRLLQVAEEHGLVHNVDNCQGHLKVLCNCCPCCCPAIKSYKSGLRNIDAPSRFVAVWEKENCIHCNICMEICPIEAISAGDASPLFDRDICIGCGLCASHCKNGAIKMVLRDELPRIPKTNDQLWSTIRNEAVVAMVKNKVSDLFK
jgi:Pyruvate/2-oxoacid:ferredoxin oxidoreductase delta subunit